MSKRVLTLVAVISFITVFPLSIRIGDRFFTRQFDKSLFDPILLICPDHIETLLLHELFASDEHQPRSECTFQVAPDRQSWVENAVRNLRAPNANKASWVIHIKQLGSDRQRIQFELYGDGVRGMIYEVQSNTITPLNSRLTGPGGAIFFLLVQLCLWPPVYLFARFVIRRLGPTPPPRIRRS